MDHLFAHYSSRLQGFDGNVLDAFTQFFDMDWTPIHAWLKCSFSKKVVKDNSLSSRYRQEGNHFYARKDRAKSLELYVKSLQFAVPYNEEYGLALANRSAVLFEMREFRHCLKDIELCLRTDYPQNLKMKILLRQAECYFELCQMEALTNCLSEISGVLELENATNKAKFTPTLNSLIAKKSSLSKNVQSQENTREIPPFPDGENKHLAYASSKVKMRYNKDCGRHIVASADLKRGDILFIEPAFVFAPIFKDNKQFHSFKCYSCLDDVISRVPCQYCTLCAYCDERCRDLSWMKDHRWECAGMQANIWYDLGIALPAFKTMLMGVRSGFETLEYTPERDLEGFGDKRDNYPYFNRLMSNLPGNQNVEMYIVMAAVVVSYLQVYTDFFPWLLKQPKCPCVSLDDVMKYLGSIVIKHIAQLACNAGTIENWRFSSVDLLFPDLLVTTACGIFPSVSIMNHSCKPNVANYFIRDTIIVKALEDIPLNAEVFNCYGIDYRTMKKGQRQDTCKKLYDFECKCIICCDPTRELEFMDCYLCLQCKGLIPETNKTYSFCLNCRKKYNLQTFRQLRNEAGKYLSDNSSMEVGTLIKNLSILEKILFKYHQDFEDIYYYLYNLYVEQGDVENIFKYINLWLDNVKTRKGDSARTIGPNLYEGLLAVLHCLQTGQHKHTTDLKSFLETVECMIKEAKIILNLHYPPYVTSRLSSKVEFVLKK